MAHHHHHHPASQTAGPIPRPLILRILSITALILPTILYLLSMSFSLATIYNPRYSLSDLYNSTSQPSGVSLYASPFFHCSATSDGTVPVDEPSSYNQSCARVSFLGKAGMNACLAAFSGGFPDTQYCQKSVSAASLYVSGAVLAGIAILVAAVHAGLGWKSASATETVPAVAAPKEESTGAEGADAAAGAGSTLLVVVPFVEWFAAFLGLLAALCLLAAQMLGISSTVNDRHPTSSESPDGYQGRWYMGTPAFAFSSVAWLSAVLGAYVASTGFGLKGR